MIARARSVKEGRDMEGVVVRCGMAWLLRWPGQSHKLQLFYEELACLCVPVLYGLSSAGQGAPQHVQAHEQNHDKEDASKLAFAKAPGHADASPTPKNNRRKSHSKKSQGAE